MPKSLVLLFTCVTMLPGLQAADTGSPQEKHQARDSEMAWAYVPLDSWAYFLSYNPLGRVANQ
jgi:hypothetical protein